MAARTLTLMQGFQEKKKSTTVSPFPYPYLRESLLIASQASPDHWKARALITRPRYMQRFTAKMPNLNQMYEKKAIEEYA